MGRPQGCISESNHNSNHDGSDEHDERHWPVLQKEFTQKQQHQRGSTECERSRIGLWKSLKEMRRALPEISVTTAEAA